MEYIILQEILPLTITYLCNWLLGVFADLMKAIIVNDMLELEMLGIIYIIITLKSKEFDTHIQFVRMNGIAVYMSLASVDIK